MKTKRRLGLFLVLISGGLSVLWGCSLGWSIQGGPLDFQAVYYGARTLIHHQNPYNVSDLETVFQSDGRDHSSLTPKQHHLITLFVNTPATLFFVAPFALLPLVAGQALWIYCREPDPRSLPDVDRWGGARAHTYRMSNRLPAPELSGCFRRRQHRGNRGWALRGRHLVLRQGALYSGRSCVHGHQPCH